MKKRYLIIVIILIILILLGNSPYGIFIGKPIIHVYYYESSDRGFSEIEVPEKGRSLEIVLKQFEEYKELSGKSDIQLYRTSSRNPLNFYEWADFE